ncbi:MAG: CDC27 family protein [Treponema sp.]|jgi:tetratricopeptide (TPR) repeat protein|nr:CDC27 family protein [Treponema sp.]
MEAMRGFIVCSVVFCVCALSGLGAQEPLFGDPAAADRYVLWAEAKLAAGKPAEALAALERGADYAPVSADFLYLLAYARKIGGVPAALVLEAGQAALENGRWGRYSAAACRLLLAETCIQLRRYGRALALLESSDEIRSPVPSSSAGPGGRGVPETYPGISGDGEFLLLRLRCRRALGEDGEFIRLMEAALSRYPRDARFVRLLFETLGGKSAEGGFVALRDLALRRLPFLVEDNPGLAYAAVPFMPDVQEAARYVAASRAAEQAGAAGNPDPESISPALFLGLIDDRQAVAELFGGGVSEDSRKVSSLDRERILDVWKNIRSEEGRAGLRRNLFAYSGVIREDADTDGFFEISVRYQNGLLSAYRYDADQDGTPEWEIRFGAGAPLEADVSIGDKKALLTWERYPAVLHTDYDRVRYIPRPADFFFTPLRFAELVPSGPLYPQRDGLDAVLTERRLLSSSVALERESAEFPGGVEVTQFRGGMAARQAVYLDGNVVSETEFSDQGRPLVERVDLDLDGRMETVRQYSRVEYGLVISTECDWDGDGVYEYAEVPESGGTVKRYWDLDGDGIRETER